MSKLIFHLEADSIEELRAQAILALDLRIATATQAAAKVEELAAPDEYEATTDEAIRNLTEEVAELQEKVADDEKPAPKKRGRKPKAAALSTMVAEIEAPAKPLDINAVRTVFDEYVAKFGVAAAQEDGPILMGRVYGNAIQRIKDIPEDDQVKLGRIVASVQGAILTNEFKRQVMQ